MPFAPTSTQPPNAPARGRGLAILLTAASIVVIAATLAYFGLPEAGIGIILAVDQLLDMGRSATNVVGNSVASAVVAKWENQISDPEPDEAEAKPA